MCHMRENCPRSVINAFDSSESRRKRVISSANTYVESTYPRTRDRHPNGMSFSGMIEKEGREREVSWPWSTLSGDRFWERWHTVEIVRQRKPSLAWNKCPLVTLVHNVRISMPHRYNDPDADLVFNGPTSATCTTE